MVAQGYGDVINGLNANLGASDIELIVLNCSKFPEPLSFCTFTYLPGTPL